MKIDINTPSDEKLKGALKQIQLRAQVQLGRTLTHNDLAELAGVTKRSLGDWMRGVCAPPGMSAILELLSHLDESDVAAVLEYWRTGPSFIQPPNQKLISASHKGKKKLTAQTNPQTKTQRY